MGMSMKIERSTLDEVKKRFELNKKKKEESKKEFNFEDRMKELKEEEIKAKEKRNENKKEKKAKAEQTYAENLDEDDKDMLSMMGFASFSTSKKQQFIYFIDMNVTECVFFF